MWFTLVINLLSIQSKKDVAQIFNSVLRRQIGTWSPTVEYIYANKDMLFSLSEGKFVFKCLVISFASRKFSFMEENN